MKNIKVFLDSNIVQHAATTYRTADIFYGGAKPGEPLIRHGPIETIHKPLAKSEELQQEIEKLPKLSSIFRSIKANLIMDHNNFSEIKKAGRFRKEYFYGADITYANRPPEFNTLFACPGWFNFGPTENQFHNFLHRLENPRFLELAKYAGALQGKKDNYNQLADAYFLWCAEENNVDYFLTLDFKLKRSIENARRLSYTPKVVTASQLLEELKKTIQINQLNTFGTGIARARRFLNRYIS